MSESLASRRYPAGNAEGGWRSAATPEETCDLARLDSNTLALAVAEQDRGFGGEFWAICVVRHGYLAAELTSYSGSGISRFEVASVTQSFTALRFGMLFADTGYGHGLNLDSKLYDYIPAGHPLADKRKADVTIG
jgi:CubicO group peptidase (beta-lactamase class C family)